MGKSAGIFKKLKKVGNLIGKGASWVNKNIIKPLNPVIDTALDFVPGGSAIKTAKNFVTKGLDYLGDNVYNTQTNQRIGDTVRYGADVLLDTQRAPKDRKYNFGNYMDDSDDDSSDEPPRKTYNNPFGQPIN
ncbi:hypothetical protein [Methanobrevibacter sp.]